ncbi:uncharacterized protein DS421_16g550520 [Arachis hypogaea]|nr:uncharacterized protein DS421_16g550520 [Arachis hypogaea]
MGKVLPFPQGDTPLLTQSARDVVYSSPITYGQARPPSSNRIPTRTVRKRKKGNGELEGETEGKKEGNEEQRERVREQSKKRGRRIAAPCCSLRRLPSLSPEPEDRERTLARERTNARRRRARARRTAPPLRRRAVVAAIPSPSLSRLEA